MPRTLSSYFSRVPNLPPSQTLWMRKLDAGDVNQGLQEAENRGGGYFRDVPRCPGCRCTRPRLLLADQSVSSECWPVSAAGDGMLPSCSPLCPLSTFLFSLVSGQVGSEQVSDTSINMETFFPSNKSCKQS